MAGNKGEKKKENKRKTGSIGIRILVFIGILFLASGLLYGKYLFDQETLNDGSELSVMGLTVGAVRDVQEGSAGEDIGSENGDNSETGLTVGAVRDVQDSSGTSATDDDSDAEITLVMIGDMLMHTPVINSGKQADGTYNFDHLFVNVADKIESADIAIVNQETIMGGDDRGFSGYPTFNSPTALADAEAAVGFDVILHGTNHALDKGASGILNCIAYWETNYPDIAYLGINKSQEAQDTYIYVYEQDGISVAILNYTYGTNGISTPSGQSYLVNYLDEDKVVSDIERAHELADFVIVCPHWGTEYNLGTDSSQAKWTQIFLEEGVDLVIGTHPHVIEPVEWVTDEDGNEMLVYYSLGNFVNGTSSTGSGVTNRMVGGMAEVTIGIEDGEVVILDYDAIPLVSHMGEGTDFTVYYLSDYTEELAQQNQIISQDPEFSLEKCWKVVEQVWGD